MPNGTRDTRAISTRNFKVVSRDRAIAKTLLFARAQRIIELYSRCREVRRLLFIDRLERFVPTFGMKPAYRLVY
jgi:hypothetical protein